MTKFELSIVSIIRVLLRYSRDISSVGLNEKRASRDVHQAREMNIRIIEVKDKLFN